MIYKYKDTISANVAIIMLEYQDSSPLASVSFSLNDVNLDYSSLSMLDTSYKETYFVALHWNFSEVTASALDCTFPMGTDHWLVQVKDCPFFAKT